MDKRSMEMEIRYRGRSGITVAVVVSDIVFLAVWWYDMILLKNFLLSTICYQRWLCLVWLLFWLRFDLACWGVDWFACCTLVPKWH